MGDGRSYQGPSRTIKRWRRRAEAALNEGSRAIETLQVAEAHGAGEEMRLESNGFVLEATRQHVGQEERASLWLVASANPASLTRALTRMVDGGSGVMTIARVGVRAGLISVRIG